MIDPKKIRKDFPVYSNNPNLIYFDSAASALKVIDAIKEVDHYHHELGVNAHRGAYHLAYETTKKYEEARITMAEFINADVDEVVFTRGATTSLNMVANHYKTILKEGDEIITSELEHHSSLMPWQQVAKQTGAKLVFIPLSQEGRITIDSFLSVLTKNTKIVALTHVSNVLGYHTPIEEITKHAHKYNALVVLDAAQSAPHIKLDVKSLKIDFMAFSGHKMFGPTGVGILYGKKALLNDFEPFEYGGEMADEVYKTEATYKQAPQRLEAGTPNIAGVYGIAAAAKYIKRIGHDQISEHTKMLHQYLLNKMTQLLGVTIYNKTAEHPVITFNIDGVHPHDASTMLDQFQIGVRSGHHCAHLVSRFLNVNSTIRVSIHLYNTIEDCDILVDGIIKTRDFFNSF
jgi:cysteine desulfurase / selenocysteine lyase